MEKVWVIILMAYNSRYEQWGAVDLIRSGESTRRFLAKTWHVGLAEKANELEAGEVVEFPLDGIYTKFRLVSVEVEM